jgi:hypothetical protein
LNGTLSKYQSNNHQVRPYHYHQCLHRWYRGRCYEWGSKIKSCSSCTEAGEFDCEWYDKGSEDGGEGVGWLKAGMKGQKTENQIGREEHGVKIERGPREVSELMQ